MLSRVAENLYWLSRYVERAESLARMLDDAFHLELDAADLTGDTTGRGPVDGVLTILACRTAFESTHGPGNRDTVLRFLTFDRQNNQSILAVIARARENARGTQETLSSEAWSQVNRLYLYLSGPRAQRRFQASPFRFYESIKRACILFDGLVDNTLPRTEVYHFLQVGRYLERVDQISRILNVKFHTLGESEWTAELPLRTVHWSSLLRSCSAYHAYLKQHRDRIEPKSVVQFLILDADFPRALRFGVTRWLASLHELAEGEGNGYGSEAERLLGRLDSELRYMDSNELFGKGLYTFLTGVQEACARIDRELHQAYFLG
jgi:uncharacterized alpha-E superfamily protein